MIYPLGLSYYHKRPVWGIMIIDRTRNAAELKAKEMIGDSLLL